LATLSGSLPEIAKKYGADAVLNSATDLVPSNGFVAGMGYDPYLVGRIFGMKTGQVSKPIVYESGVGVIKVESSTPAVEIADYTQYKTQLIQNQSGRTEFSIRESLKEYSDIEDNRYKFF
jgi:peptidyl-prolyl cis-trans isomerase D